ncbi:TlpA family protein disulfide reductase [candidate division WOR-3 bacterium]|nr:TlpA family protein disulfide reductase [candidate division WOR-3 bacterium]
MRLTRLLLVLVFAAGLALAAEETEYEQAIDFTLPDVSGASVTLDSLLAVGPVYMECWDLPCVNCIAELDALMPVYDSLKDRGLQIVALSVDKPGDEARVKAFVKSKKWPYICLLDAQNEVKKAYGIIIKPTAYLINMQGEIVYTHIGYKKGDEQEIAEEFLKWLPEQPVEEAPTDEDK